MVISRLLFGKGEPSSIFEHVDAHVRPGVAGLTEGGDTLPDEPAAAGTELVFAPGATERIFSTVPSEDDLEAVERIYRALAALARKPSQQHRKRVRELFREGRVRARIDPLRDRLSAESPPKAVELYPELKELFLRSGYRDEVKYAIALLAGFGRPEDADPFRVIGRHEEFTMYAAVALGSVVADPLEEWLQLLEHVNGWGRTELSELILREPRSEDARERLVRNGLGHENALMLASGCRLDELLAHEQVDAGVLAGAEAIVDALVGPWDNRHDLTDYPEAGPAVEYLLGHLRRHPQGLQTFLTVFDLERFVTNQAEAGALEASGFDAERRARVLAACADLLAGGPWAERATAALRSDDEHERHLGLEVAERLGLDVTGSLVESLRAAPGDTSLWWAFVKDAGEARMRAAVDLALELWDLGEIATGPALDLIEFGEGPLACVGLLVQELERHPGLGGPLLAAALQSPVIGDRTQALRALAHWEHVPADLLEPVAAARAKDPDADVRRYAAAVLAGDPIPED